MPKTGTPAVKSAGSSAGRALGVHRRRAAGQDDRLRLAGQHLGDRHRVRHDLGVDPRLAHPAGDQLGVLGPEVDDEDQVVVGHAVDLRGRRRARRGPPTPYRRPARERARARPARERWPGPERPAAAARQPPGHDRARPGREDGRALTRRRSAHRTDEPPWASPSRGPGVDAASRTARGDGRDPPGSADPDDRQPQGRRGGLAGPPGASGRDRRDPLVRRAERAGAGRPRPCWARTPSPARPGR